MRRSSRKFVARLHAAYRKADSVPEVAAKFGLRPNQVYGLLRRDGFKCRKWRGGSPKRITLDLIRQMHADYERPMSLAAIGRKYGRCGTQVRALFVSRGLFVRPYKNAQYNPANGRILPLIPKTAKEVSEIIARQTKIRIPGELRHEWRQWPMKKRGAFIARLRRHINSPNDRPTTPFSANVEPFDYASPKSCAIAAKLNAGLGSRDARMKIDLCSQGVIYKRQLFFWSSKAGYSRGPWTHEHGRPLLHPLIWREATGCKVPPSHVIRFVDGNQNNLLPNNMVLAHRNDVCREVQAKALLRKSRERTAVLLQRAQRKEKHGLIEELRRAA